jgi:hypothetical protein
MKWGDKYGPEYVNKLYSMVKKNLTKKFRFVCFTDDAKGIEKNVEIKPMPELDIPKKNQGSPWRKLTVFAKDLGGLKGQTMFIDLDVVIVDNIDCFFEYAGSDFTIIENWTQKGRGIGNSSVYILEIGKYTDVLDHYKKNTQEVVDKYDNEQIYLSKYIGNIKYWPEDWCKSFKCHCLPGGPGGILNWFKTPVLPEKSKIIVFHGNPKPEDAIVGQWPGSWRKHVRPTAWVKKYWA